MLALIESINFFDDLNASPSSFVFQHSLFRYQDHGRTAEDCHRGETEQIQGLATRIRCESCLGRVILVSAQCVVLRVQLLICLYHKR